MHRAALGLFLVNLCACHPEQDTREEQARTALSRVVFDPSSLQLIDVKAANDNKGVCGLYNAKNRFGGYVGVQGFLLEGDKLSFIDPIRPDISMIQHMAQQCGSAEDQANVAEGAAEIANIQNGQY